MKRISDAELEVMKILWNKKNLTSVEIIDSLLLTTNWNRNTIKTLINRLVKKGAVKNIKKIGSLNKYIPLIDEEKYKNQESTNFIKKLYNGSVNNMLLNFVHEEKISKDDIKYLIELIESEDK